LIIFCYDPSQSFLYAANGLFIEREGAKTAEIFMMAKNWLAGELNHTDNVGGLPVNLINCNVDFAALQLFEMGETFLHFQQGVREGYD
jgi:hypothetical protein